MSLADRLANPRVRGKDRCVVESILDDLADADAAAVRAALADRSYTAGFIAESLTSEGYKISDTAIIRHRTSRCCCVSR